MKWINWEANCLSLFCILATLKLCSQCVTSLRPCLTKVFSSSPARAFSCQVSCSWKNETVPNTCAAIWIRRLAPTKPPNKWDTLLSLAAGSLSRLTCGHHRPIREGHGRIHLQSLGANLKSEMLMGGLEVCVQRRSGWTHADKMWKDGAWAFPSAKGKRNAGMGWIYDLLSSGSSYILSLIRGTLCKRDLTLKGTPSWWTRMTLCKYFKFEKGGFCCKRDTLGCSKSVPLIKSVLYLQISVHITITYGVNDP